MFGNALAYAMTDQSPARSVWVIEDDAAVCDYLVDVLRRPGLSVTAFRLAQVAYDALASEVPDLIILDLGMPRGTMEGMEFLARLREADAWKGIPVVILSGFGDVVNRDVTARLGVTAILSKPIVDMDELVRIVHAVAD
jgi:DNA-binding response OmpR family regulator